MDQLDFWSCFNCCHNCLELQQMELIMIIYHGEETGEALPGLGAVYPPHYDTFPCQSEASILVM